MRPLHQAALVCALAVWSGIPAASHAQDVSSPDVVVDLNEAIHHYLQGSVDHAFYEQAIEQLNSVIEREPGNAPGLLFRALAYGRVGLHHRTLKNRREALASVLDEVIKIREQAERRTQLEQEKSEFERQLQDPALEPWRRLLIQSQLEERSAVLASDDDRREEPVESLRSALAAAKDEMHAAAGRERDQYILMIADLEQLIKALREPEAVIRLLEVISKSKVARIDEDEAVRVMAGDVVADRPDEQASRLRDSSAETLEQVAGVLEELLRRDLSGEEAARVRFFLGVIRFRQAVPRRAEGEERVTPGETLLQSAQSVMTELADDEKTETNWRSYASLYLGLIIPFHVGREPQRRDELLDEAERRLNQAAKWDLRTDPEGGPPFSASGDAIPLVVTRQMRNIERIREQPATVREYLNDVQLSVAIGAHRDTNVPLLGERTDLPRDISRQRDYGFTLGSALDYTLGLGKLDPRLDKWTLGVRGRVSQLWHADVDEFDEQRYGGSAAIQYELLEEKESLGPVYLRMQYDYDYTLLGREAFLDYHTLSPNVQIFWLGRRAETDLYFRYEIRDYHEPLFDRRFDRDGEYYALGLLQSYKLTDMTPVYERLGVKPWGHKYDEELRQDDPDWPQHWFEVLGGFQYSWDSTDGDEFDQKAYALTAGFLAPLPYGLEFDAAFEFEWEDYAHGSRVDFHRNGRNDFIQHYAIGLSRTFVLRPGKLTNRYNPAMDRLLMTVRGHSTWTLDDSNVVDRMGQAIFSYDRVVYGITVAFTFN